MGLSRAFQIFLAASVCWAVFSQQAHADTVVFGPNDTLSEIAATHLRGYVYGPKGTLTRLRALNPHIKDDRRIRPGTVIELGFENLRSRSIASVPEQAPQPQEAVSEAEHYEVREPEPNVDKPFLVLGLTPALFFSKLDLIDEATRGRASVRSGTNKGFAFEAKKPLSFEISPRFRWQYWNTNWEGTATKPLADNEVDLHRIAVGAELNAWGDGAVATELFFGQQLMLRGSTPRLLVLERSWVPGLLVEFKKDIVQYHQFIMRGNAAAAVNFPVNSNGYRVKWGHQYYGKIDLRRAFGAFEVNAGPWSRYLRFSSAMASGYQLDLGFGVGLEWRLNP